MDNVDSSRPDSHQYDGLLHLAQSGAPAAATATHEVFVAYRPVVWRALPELVYDRALLDDARQDADLALLLTVHRFDLGRGTSFGAYAKRCVRGAILNSIRNARDMRNWEELDDELISNDQPELPDFASEAAVRQFVQDLPERKRRIVESVFWDGKSQADVARALGISRAAVNKHLESIFQLGRQKLHAFDPVRPVA